MPFWTLRRKAFAAGTLLVALTFGWAAVVVAVALAGAHDEARSADCRSPPLPPIPPSGRIRDATRLTSSPRGSRSLSPGSSTTEGAHAARKPSGLHRPGRAA